MARKLKKVEKLEISTVGHGIWQENWKSCKWETSTWRIKKSQNHWKTWKMRNAQCRFWNLARKRKITENEKHPLEALKNDEITEKREKWEMHTVEPRIWREKWKSQKMRNTHFRMWNTARKTEKGGKFRNVHCRTWNRARTQIHGKRETTPETREKRGNRWKTGNMARKLKITENEKYTL